MGQTPIEVQGTVQADGTQVLDEKLSLPAGRVRVTVQPVGGPARSQDPFWVMMEGIWAAQKARGHKPRSEEEINAAREEAEEEMRESEAAHRECERARQQ